MMRNEGLSSTGGKESTDVRPRLTPDTVMKQDQCKGLKRYTC
jgi:hypothetical protein